MFDVLIRVLASSGMAGVIFTFSFTFIALCRYLRFNMEFQCRCCVLQKPGAGEAGGGLDTLAHTVRGFV